MTDYLDQTPGVDDRRLASVFDEVSLWSARFGLLMLEHLAPTADSQLLDLGCGAGFPLLELAHAWGRSCHFVGADLWQAALARALAKKQFYALQNAALVQADGHTLPFGDGQFDLIVSNVGINNFADPQTVLSQCARVAKPQGRIALTTNPKGHMQQFYNLYRQALLELNMDQYLERLEANENHRLSGDAISKMLQTAGFRVSRIVEDKFYMRFLDGSAMLRHGLIRYGFLDGWRTVVDPDVEKTVFAALEKKLNEAASRHGALKMTVPMLYLEGKRSKGERN